MMRAKRTRSLPPRVSERRPSAFAIMKCASAPFGLARTAASASARACMYRVSRRRLRESSSLSICFAMSTSDGGALTPEEWSALVAAYTAGRVPDYQMAALLMAVYFRGLERPELAALTDAMLASGQRLAFDGWATPRIDKHSTGGVGDKVSLVLAPLVAACGVAVPMMSGRGLGHTGGTLDKLEAIPGFRTGLSVAETRAQVMKLCCVLMGQTGEIAPTDRALYALRDVTATVESIPLIAASIISKKLAEGLTGLVLDVKRGSGAFLPSLDRGLELANTMIDIGAEHGCPVVALLTAMDRPLGRACGNALEVEESIAALRGE